MMTDYELRKLALATDQEMETVQRFLTTALDELKAWESEPNLSLAERQQHKEALLMAYARFRILQGRIAEQINLLQRMGRQHQSAKDAFESGWKARLTDLAARATGHEYAQLCRLLEQIAGDEESLPF